MIRLRRENGRIVRVGHRGAAALAPENTLRSLGRALELGVDLVEFDVLEVLDGSLVLAHSNDLYEVSHGAARGRVRSRTLAQLRAVAPDLATLDEALSFLAGREPRAGLQVDIKWHGYERPVVEALQRHGVAERTLVSSYFAHSLRLVGTLEPQLRLAISYPLDRHALSTRRPLAPVVWGALAAMRQALPRRIGGLLERANASAAMLNHWLVSRAVVERCHARGAAVFAWTVDDPRLLERVVEAGVDGVVSNDPRIFDVRLTA